MPDSDALSEVQKILSIQKIEEFDFCIPGDFSAEVFRAAVSYQPRPDDVFLVTYPKCGTTWTQQILVLLFNEGKPFETFADFQSATPFLEISGPKAAEVMPRPGSIKVHLPFRLTPRSDSAKYIYVARNPKDCCVSYFHHVQNVPGKRFGGTFGDFFEIFLSGNTQYGDYFDHLLGWYEHRNDPNVLFITYEELKTDLASSILKLAAFLDEEKYATPLRQNPKLLEPILQYSSFDYMKSYFNQKMTDVFNMSEAELEASNIPEAMRKMIQKNRAGLKLGAIGDEKGTNQKPDMINFIRKGVVGDWRNYFSEDQSRRMDEKFAKRTAGTDIPDLWKDYM